MRKTFINSCLAICLVGLGIVIKNKLASQKKKKPKVSYKAPDTHYDIITIQNSNIKIDFTKQGKVINKNSIVLTPEVSGQIVWSAEINEGQTVKKGQRLYSIDNTSINLELKVLKSDFLQLIANNIIDIEADFPQSYNSWKSFFEKLDIDKSLPKLPHPKSTKEKTFLASKGIHKQYYTIQQKEHLLSKHTITAPFSGQVSNIKTKKGSSVSPNSAMLTLAKNNDLEIKVPVPFTISSFIKLSQIVFLKNGVQGKISRIDNFIDESTQSINLYIKPNTTTSLREGMYTTVSFSQIILPNTCQIPLSSIYNGKEVVSVRKDSTTTALPITILHKTSEYIYTNNLSNQTKILSVVNKDFLIGQKIK